ncbi:MAG: cytochrome c1 [Chaenotheca gracillima]|nr:MAG: cytochrome c1 [Chaenotheca gracillima]
MDADESASKRPKARQNLEDFYKRHPRPQGFSPPSVPTKAALSQRSNLRAAPLTSLPPVSALRSKRDVSQTLKRDLTAFRDCSGSDEKPANKSSFVTVQERSPWLNVRRLGRLQQDHASHFVCSPNHDFLDMVMYRKVLQEQMVEELDVLRRLSHPNILKLRNAFLYQDAIYLETEYCRHTLLEILHVHIPIGEKQIEIIACSIFEAVRYLAQDEVNDGIISMGRQQRSNLTPRPPMGADLWCRNILDVPRDADRLYTFYWVWDWPTAPNVDLNVLEGKNEVYTTCIDIEVVDVL